MLEFLKNTPMYGLKELIRAYCNCLVQVDAWMKKIIDSPPFNSLLVVVLTGSHDSFANGACLVKIKKPNMKLKHRKTE